MGFIRVLSTFIRLYWCFVGHFLYIKFRAKVQYFFRARKIFCIFFHKIFVYSNFL